MEIDFLFSKLLIDKLSDFILFILDKLCKRLSCCSFDDAAAAALISSVKLEFRSFGSSIPGNIRGCDLGKYGNDEDEVDDEAEENGGVRLADEEIDDDNDEDDAIELFLISLLFPLFGFFNMLSLFCFLHFALLFLNQTF